MSKLKNSKLADIDGPVSAVMTPLPLVVESSTSFHTVERLFQRYDIRHLPVMDGSVILGVISDREVEAVIRSTPQSKDSEPIRAVVVKAFLEAEADARAIDVINEMASKKYDCSLILREKKVVGIFTLSDAIQLLLRFRTLNALPGTGE